ncbi:hypothetical protein IP91_05083 [Pseudoduganella lurida]|uniref:Uncharacterized protein n=1 Tax=Pseudoduganella lurida TaxID=1036180 RepID=A0A562QV46_9BURK|nr:hypothetical protein IP91_05083 [Pseudoduganella lurida]
MDQRALRWRRLIRVQKATKTTTMEPHTAATDNISSFMLTQLSLYDNNEIMLHLHMKHSH